MKSKVKLTGKRFRHSAERQGIQILPVIDSLRPMRVVVWVIGPWAYQLTDE